MLIALCLALAQGETPELRRAVERSLPFLEKGGLAWRSERKCASCHHVTFMIWSHREALERGFAVDPAKLEEWTRWALDFSLASKTKEGMREGGGLETMAQIILARPSTSDPAPYRELAELIRGMRKPGVAWEAGGQLPSQRRPKDETNDVSSMWVLRALDSLGLEEDRAWLKERKPGSSAESIAMHLLTRPSEPLMKELLSRQNEDGGWSWLRGESSDALATGQILYVLSQVKSEVEPIRRAQAFLVKTQREDGSWKVPSTKAKPKDDSISTYWGTAWATIGLLRTLPQP